MKQKILIVYSKMIVGGSTTSLLSLLNELDYQRFEVDLLLFEKGGVLEKQIPREVNILDNSFLHMQKLPLSYVFAFIFAFVKSKLKRNILIRSQVMSKYLAKGQAPLDKQYDVAIAYLEFWPSQYVIQKVNAKRKILWLHVDYASTKLDMRYDKQMYERADAVVTVSEACKKNLMELLPSVNNIYCIHNVLSAKTVRNLAASYTIDTEQYAADLIFVTVARIDFNHKGHDRGITVFKKIKKLYLHKSFKWLIIGDGPDRKQLQSMIEEADLKNEVILLGELTNPHPYVKMADFFFLPSRYEGQPMAVTEAQMNGIIPLVTNYASAHNQIINMVDGLICDNHDEALFSMINKIFSGEIDVCAMKKRLAETDYSNREEIEKIYQLLCDR